ncbi:Calcium-responsive transactivator [Bagarius yarrelli]|uniref:Calcium-responsive transactivator n=1 Tax=Bagarius yarrelli TaxID=175774 RepID=A0A556V732_BAGYA|nr:Calcium-responsive transactivator [Bagarius yarrelli]
MSVAFSSTRPRGKGEVTQQTIQKPPNPAMSMGQGGMGGSSAGGSLHSQSNLNDSMAPSSLMQSQISNGLSHTLMQQQQQSGPSNSSMNSGSNFPHSVPSSSSAQGTVLYPPSRTNLNIQSSQVTMMQGSGPHYSSSGGQHYQGQQSMSIMGQSNQGNSLASQRPIGSYRPAQQGSQYMGQEEFYGEQFGHTPSSSEPVNQQYYPDGHSEYSFQPSAYSEQSYDRSFEDSSQHYYEGGPGQGAPSQYSQYQQGQNQQYSSYRSTQSTPGPQTQRSYTYEQSQYGNYQQ